VALSALESPLGEFVPDTIWLKRYAVRYFGLDVSARLTLIRLADGSLLAHSPCPIDDALSREIETLGELRHIVAPGNFHYFYVADWQRAFPNATTWICPGVETKRPDLHFDWLLGDRSPEVWQSEIDQALVRGSRFMWEVAFFHRPSRVLILTDLVENVGDATPGARGLQLMFWWKIVFRMWNRARPAPEYQLGWRDKRAARRSLERILAWDIDRVVIAHGDCIEEHAKERLLDAWARPLRG
jgi:hypothetical protein